MVLINVYLDLQEREVEEEERSDRRVKLSGISLL